MIVSRKLESIQQSHNGTIFASFLAIDDKGREWRRSRSRFVDETAAQTVLDAYDWTLQLQNRERVEIIQFVTEGNSPDDFIRTDLTVQQFRKCLAREFSKSSLQENKDFLCSISPWIAGFTTNQIANSLKISQGRATKILNRAVRFRDGLCASLAADDNDIDEIE